jgi:hypothetical protein
LQISRRFTPRTTVDDDTFMFDFGDPAAVNEFGDVGPNLAEGETIDAVTVTAGLYAYATQPSSPASLTVSGTAIADGPTMPASRVLARVLAGGTNDAEYVLTCTVTTSTGRIARRSGRVLTTTL